MKKKIMGILTIITLHLLPSFNLMAINEHPSNFSSPEKIQKNNKKQKDFIVATQPKSGTFLLAKTLTMLTSTKMIAWPVWASMPGESVWKFADEDPDNLPLKERFSEIFNICKSSNRFSLCHFNFSEYYRQFLSENPDCQVLCMIRDLRSVAVSQVFFLSEQIEAEIQSSNFDDKLMYVIKKGTLSTRNGQFWSLGKNAERSLDWFNYPNALIVRFEHLIGPKGGGSLKKQEKQIKEIAKHLSIPLTSERLNKITKKLFGVDKGPDVSGTYRDGQIDGWVPYYKEEHKQAFNEYLGSYQLALGYPIF